MPMFPSGRHIAINPELLRRLLHALESPTLSDTIVAIKGMQDLFAWFELAELVREIQAAVDQLSRALLMEMGPLGS